MGASLLGRTDTVEYLLAKGASVSATTKRGQTALLVAVEHGNAGTVVALIEAGADACGTSTEGETALALASSKGRDAIVTVLRERCGAE